MEAMGERGAATPHPARRGVPRFASRYAADGESGTAQPGLAAMEGGSNRAEAMAERSAATPQPAQPAPGGPVLREPARQPSERAVFV